MADSEFQAAVEETVVDQADDAAYEPQVVEIDGEVHELADFSQADLWEQRAEQRRAGAITPTPDVSWQDMIPKDPEPEPEPEPVQRKAKATTVKEEPEPEREIKKPWGRIRRLEKERNEAKRSASEVDALKGEIQELKALLQRAVAPPQEEDVEVPPDPQIAPVQAILHELRETKAKLEKIEQEKEQERQLAIARTAINEVDSRLNQEIASDPVFKSAFNHVTRVVLNNVKDDPRFGATEQERRMNAFSQLLKKELEWYEKGKDPVEEVYRQAIKFGFDPDETMQKLGVSYDEEGRPVTEDLREVRKMAEEDAPKARAKAQKAQTPLEKIQQARQRREGTASIAGVVGRPVKNFNAKHLAGKTDKEINYLVRKAVDQGELPKSKKSNFPELAALLEGTDAIFDDGR